MRTEREAVYLINRMESLGPVWYDRLLMWYGSAADAWAEEQVPLPQKQAQEWTACHADSRETAVLRELEELPSRGIAFLCRNEEDFPAELLAIHSPPVGLYLKGSLPPEGSDLVAMVGARRCSEYGKTTARELAGRLAEEGITVVSGMAMGIDAWSHLGALEAGGFSLAFLGCGIDMPYPPSNARLYDRLAAEGGILSEYGPGTMALPFHFPLRNRLISGISRVVLVLEAREKSGSLITVDCALEQGKEVLALPGRIGDPLSQGCNQLIRQGAGILTGVSDVLLALGHAGREAEASERRAADPREGLPEDALRILGEIGTEPVHPDRIASATGIRITEIYRILWDLECRNLIRSCSHGMVIRKPGL